MTEPTPPTVEQLQADIAKLKAALDGSLPKVEADKVRAELAAARAELAAAKAPPAKTETSSEAEPGVFKFPKLF